MLTEYYDLAALQEVGEVVERCAAADAEAPVRFLSKEAL
jgi:hypothetical protein